MTTRPVAPERPAERPNRRDHRGLRKGTGRRAQDRELRGLVRRQLRPQVRRAVPDDLHAQIPPDRCLEHEHRLARAAHVPAQPRGTAARRTGAVEARDALLHELPLSVRRRVPVLPASVAGPGRHPAEPEGLRHRPKGEDGAVRRRERHPLRRPCFLDSPA